MPDPHHIVDEIRTFLQSTDQTLTDRVRQLAHDYAAACQEANQRLRRCAEYLRKGLRTEAIHQAQTEPVLLEVVGILDFPERKRWDEMCSFYDLAAPPALQLETAAALNEAYADDQPVEELLRKHRALALMRAPLGARLRLLRRIGELDALNPIWQEDIREYEKARLRQLPAEAQLAIERKDTNRLMQLSDELSRERWLTALPPALVKQVGTAARQNVQARVVTSLQALERQLYEAMNAFDLAHAQGLRGEWDQLAAGVTRGDHPELFDRASVVFDWIDQQLRRQAEEEQYQRAVHELENALAGGAPRDALVALAAQVQDLGGMPEGLQLHYQQRLRQLDRARMLRRVVLVAVPVVLGVIASGLVALHLQRQAAAARVEAAAGRLREQLDRKQLAEARAFLDQLGRDDPETRQQPAISEQEHRLTRLEQDERDRQVLFREALKAAQEAPLGPAGEEAVVRARSRAALPEERAAVAALAADRQARWDQQMQQRDQAFLARVRDIAAGVQSVEDQVGRGEDAQTLAGLVSQQQALLDRLLAEIGTTSPAVRQQADALARRLDAARQTLGERNKEAGLLRGLSLAVGAAPDVDRYARAAAEYLKEYSDTDRSLALKQALDEQAAWRAALDWGALLRPILGDLLDVAPAEARRRAAACRGFLEKHAGYPDADTIQLYAKYLEALPQREDRNATALADLRAAFAGTLIRNVQALHTKDGKVYYVSRDVDLHGMAKTAPTNFLRFSYLAGYDGREKPAQVRLDNIASIGPAAQSILAADALKDVIAPGDDSWDRALIGVAQKVKDSTGVDPVLRIMLLRQVLDAAGKGSYPLELALQNHMQRLDKAEVDLTSPWMDPDNKAAVEPRKAALEFLENFPKFASAVEDAAAVREGLAIEVTRSNCPPVGWLYRDRDRRWQLDRPTVDLPGRHELLVLLPAEGGKLRWQVIGTLDKGKPTVELSGPHEALVEGRWVFARKIGSTN